MQIGDTVRVLPPFDNPWNGAYTIEEITPDGVYLLAGVEGGFDPQYLEVV